MPYPIQLPATDPDPRTGGPSYAQMVDEILKTAPVSVTSFGAKADISTDNTTAIQAAIDAVDAAGGGRIFFPPSDQHYHFDGPLSLYGKKNIVLAGFAVPLNSKPVSVLRYEGSNVDRVIDARSSACIGLDGLSVYNSSSTNTGYLIDFGEDFGGATDLEVYFPFLRNLAMYGNVAANTNCVHFGGAYNWFMERVRFLEYNIALLGHAVGLSGVGPGGIGKMHGLEFDSAVTTPIWSPSVAWSAYGCVFQQDVNGKPNAVRHGTNPGPDFGVKGMGFYGCWFGDATAADAWVYADGGGYVFSGGTASGYGASGGVPLSSLVKADPTNGIGACSIRGMFLDNVAGLDVGAVAPHGEIDVGANQLFNGARNMIGAQAAATGDAVGLMTNGTQPGPSVVNIDPLLSTYDTTGTWTRTALAGLWRSNFHLDNSGDSTSTRTWVINLSRGYWRLETLAAWNTDCAILTFTLDGVTMATHDTYTASPNVNGRQETASGLFVPIGGPHQLKLTVATKNASSSAYNCRLHGLQLRRALS